MVLQKLKFLKNLYKLDLINIIKIPDNFKASWIRKVDSSFYILDNENSKTLLLNDDRKSLSISHKKYYPGFDNVNANYEVKMNKNDNTFDIYQTMLNKVKVSNKIYTCKESSPLLHCFDIYFGFLDYQISSKSNYLFIFNNEREKITELKLEINENLILQGFDENFAVVSNNNNFYKIDLKNGIVFKYTSLLKNTLWNAKGYFINNDLYLIDIYSNSIYFFQL